MFNGLEIPKEILFKFASSDDIGWGSIGVIVGLMMTIIFIYGLVVVAILTIHVVKNTKKNSATNKNTLCLDTIDYGSYISGMAVDVFAVFILALLVTHLTGLVASWDATSWSMVLTWICALVIPYRILVRKLRGKTVGEFIIKSPQYINNAQKRAFLGDIVLPLILIAFVHYNLNP